MIFSGNVLPEIPTQTDGVSKSMPPTNLSQHPVRIIPAPVIDEDHLHLLLDLLPTGIVAKDAPELPAKRLSQRRIIVDRDDERVVHHTDG